VLWTGSGPRKFHGEPRPPGALGDDHRRTRGGHASAKCV